MTRDIPEDNRIEPSSEELFIQEFFDSEKIKYEPEVEIRNLKGDTKSYRRADFYLPRLEIYVEYFGLYNSTKDRRAAYDEKAKVYIKNGIPTVFLYPHELGIIDYAFHQKVVKLLKLKKFGLRKSLFRYRLNRYVDNVRYGSLRTMMIALYIYYVLNEIETGLSSDFVYLIKILCLALSVVSLFEVVRDVRRYFFLDE